MPRSAIIGVLACVDGEMIDELVHQPGFAQEHLIRVEITVHGTCVGVPRDKCVTGPGRLRDAWAAAVWSMVEPSVLVGMRQF